MNDRNVVMSNKVKPEVKDLAASLAEHLKISQGNLIEKAMKKYTFESTDYIPYLKETLKKHGVVMNEVIHNSVQAEFKHLSQNPTLLIGNFCDSHDIWEDERFEDIPLEKVTKNMIENSSYQPEWETFLREELRDGALKRINAEINDIFRFDSNLLFTLMPNLEQIFEVEIEVRLSIFDSSLPIVLAYYVELICTVLKDQNSLFPGFHHSQLHIFIGNLTEHEEIWLYTIFHSLEKEFNHKVPSVEKATEFLTVLLNNKTYEIFKLVNINTFISKAIETPESNSIFQ